MLFSLAPKTYLAYSVKYFASKLAYFADGVFSYFSTPIISATVLLPLSTLTLNGFKDSNLTISVSFISTFILIIFSFDLFPHWSIATILI